MLQLDLFYSVIARLPIPDIAIVEHSVCDICGRRWLTMWTPCPIDLCPPEPDSPELASDAVVHRDGGLDWCPDCEAMIGRPSGGAEGDDDEALAGLEDAKARAALHARAGAALVRRR
jgi:hypothetical protein